MIRMRGLVVTCMVLAAATARADSPAEVTFVKGRELMKAHKYVEACAAFQQSQQLDPEFGTLYNLAICNAEIGKLATAWTEYRQLVLSDTNAERRAKAAQEAKALEPRIPHVVLSVPDGVDGLVVKLDGADVTNLVGVPAPIDLGEHRIEATDRAGDRYRDSFTVKEEAGTTKISVKLEASSDDKPDQTDATPTEPAQPSQPVPTKIEATPPPPRSHRALAGKVLLAGGVVAIGVGLYEGYQAQDSWNNAQTLQGMPGTGMQAHQASLDAAQSGNLATALVGAGVAVGIVGV